MRVGMLTNALLRDVRFLSAICLHSGCMTLEESEKMFREQAFADAGNARQQAVRGTYDPGYLAYTLGKLMIRKLRVDWLALLGVAGQDQGLTPVEQETTAESLEELLASIAWPPEVAGCAVVVEAMTVPSPVRPATSFRSLTTRA